MAGLPAPAPIRRQVGAVEVWSTGNGSSRPPVLLVHAAWHGAWCWADGFAQDLAAGGWAVHALSLRGHAGSGPARLNTLSLRDYGDDVVAVLADLRRPAVLVGHSMGGGVVQRVLCRSDRPPVAGAALLASVPPSGALRTTLTVAREDPAAFALANLTLDLGRLVVTREQVRRLFLSADADPALVDGLHDRVQSESYRAFLDMLRPHRPARRPSDVPMLVMGGETDRIFTVAEVEATAAAWGTTAHILTDLAHDVMLDTRWRDAAAHLRGWLDGEVGGRAADGRG